jgi:hypothetical protein
VFEHFIYSPHLRFDDLPNTIVPVLRKSAATEVFHRRADGEVVSLAVPRRIPLPYRADNYLMNSISL